MLSAKFGTNLGKDKNSQDVLQHWQRDGINVYNKKMLRYIVRNGIVYALEDTLTGSSTARISSAFMAFVLVRDLESRRADGMY